jgi:antirestriction protein ArdC
VRAENQILQYWHAQVVGPVVSPILTPDVRRRGQNVPQNAVTNRPYSGCNVILLHLARNRRRATPRFLTFKQAIEAGRKGPQRRTRHLLDRQTLKKT